MFGLYGMVSPVEHLDPGTQRLPDVGGGGSENDHGRYATHSGQMGNSGIVPQVSLTLANCPGYFFEGATGENLVGGGR